MASKNDKQPKGILQSLDWITVFIYLVLIVLGWISVCGASYDLETGGSFLDFGSRSGMQIVWMGTSLALGFLLLAIDERVYESLAYLIYIMFLGLLFVTPFLAHDIKGSMSWIKIGSFSIQPAEFAKFGTALCVARVIDAFNLHLNKIRDFLICAAIIVIPMGLIVMQKETGSALVYTSFFLMFYRHGMPGCFLFTVVALVFYFVVGIRFAETPFLGLPEISSGTFWVLFAIHLFTSIFVGIYTEPKKPFRVVLWGGLFVEACALIFSVFVIPFDVTYIQLGICGLTIGYLLYISILDRMIRYTYIALFALGSMTFFYCANYVLNHVMEPHQQTRVKVLLGLEDDPKGAGYNVIQAQIAIGSGGLKGKGFLNGTQTKLKYVPEQDTDFIFCTVGEEEGFMGCTTVLLLFLALILRLIHLAERQVYTFGRVYGYCVAGVFFFHLVINVGMVLGITPVIGIPLPFFSYGGSSLWGFTILLFILLRIDAARNRLKR